MAVFVINFETDPSMADRLLLSETVEQTFPSHLRLTNNCYMVEAAPGDHPQDVLEALQGSPNENVIAHRVVVLRLDDAPPLHTTLAFTNAYVSTAEGKNFIHQRKQR
ncbi:hypothetical protein [uncultured Marinococcus sp.]|jgi:hypothetical protein|uniref:hypothetical protein n=1 Tax=uncultured Marinococcus sp. TaxID=487012 RepID=UPI00262E5B0E|nr:hypothetical protein [uncultured Marinococcus sp.]